MKTRYKKKIILFLLVVYIIVLLITLIACSVLLITSAANLVQSEESLPFIIFIISDTVIMIGLAIFAVVYGTIAIWNIIKEGRNNEYGC